MLYSCNVKMTTLTFTFAVQKDKDTSLSFCNYINEKLSHSEVKGEWTFTQERGGETPDNYKSENRHHILEVNIFTTSYRDHSPTGGKFAWAEGAGL